MPSLFEQILNHDGVIPAAERAYFEQRLRNRLLSLLLSKFVDAQKSGLTKAELARRIGRTPDVINRWLGSPSNLTTDTICDLLLGISGEELIIHHQSPLEQIQTNYSRFDELREPKTKQINSVLGSIGAPGSNKESATVQS
jgi:plasmid maintenance system antidote protein VapI